MAIETELKLRIAPEHMARLKRHPFLRKLCSERATTHKLYSVYFDTPDLKLHHDRMALRLRRVGTRWLQTLKGGGGVRAGLHQRNEWETPVTGERLDFAALEKIGAHAFSHGMQKELQPLFVTDFTRSIRLVQFEGALIEMSLDSGEIRAGKAVYTISELELELKAGEPLQLFRLGLALLDIVPLEIESTSKAEYGYRLHKPVKALVTKAHMPKLDAHVSVEEALQSTIWSCLYHLQANVSGAVKKTDDEYLHQVRIALRRLRVVMGMAGKYRGDAELESLRDLVAELGTALGRSREWDVFVTQTLPSLPKIQGIRAVAQQSEALRQHYHQRVDAALNAGDFQRLILRFGAWMNGAYWVSSDDSKDISQFAARILHKRNEKVRRYGALIHSHSEAKQLHMLRIACKGLRYSADIFSSLYEAGKAKRYLDALAKLQDRLGEFNDGAIALRLLEELDQEKPLKAVALVREQIEHGHSVRMSALHRAWKQFEKLPEFWD